MFGVEVDPGRRPLFFRICELAVLDACCCCCFVFDTIGVGNLGPGGFTIHVVANSDISFYKLLYN